MSSHCNTCEYKRFPQGGHCYMHASEPAAVCSAHTGHRARDAEVMLATAGTQGGDAPTRTLAALMALHC